jgi:hypothetical protein
MKKTYNKFEKMYMGAGKCGHSKKTSKALPLSKITGKGEKTSIFSNPDSKAARSRNKAKSKRYM